MLSRLGWVGWRCLADITPLTQTAVESLPLVRDTSHTSTAFTCQF
jgi:hypothetical protein